MTFHSLGNRDHQPVFIPCVNQSWSTCRFFSCTYIHVHSIRFHVHFFNMGADPSGFLFSSGWEHRAHQGTWCHQRAMATMVNCWITGVSDSSMFNHQNLYSIRKNSACVFAHGGHVCFHAGQVPVHRLLQSHHFPFRYTINWFFQYIPW
jgi:hypothetical protein